MKKSAYLLSLSLFIFVYSVSVKAQEDASPTASFFEELYDIPIMAGLTVLTEQSMRFDKPEGRIAQVVAFAPHASWQKISLFYKETLQQMGWQSVALNKFQRDGEFLEISSESSNSGLIIRFLLRPL